jgi:hypothetical protein
MTFSNALHIAGANDKMNIVNFSIDPEEKYTIWSGITGGFFLALAYFGQTSHKWVAICPADRFVKAKWV